MLRVACTVALLSLALATEVVAQDPGAMGGPQRRMQAPPDHWMTLDSLAEALGLTAEQKPKVAQPYTALNGVMKDAAARRAVLRQRMQQGQGTIQPGQEPTPEMRARMDSLRAEFEGYQAEADQWLAAIRNLLTPAQQAKFDALSKPQLIRRGPMRQ